MVNIAWKKDFSRRFYMIFEILSNFSGRRPTGRMVFFVSLTSVKR